MFFRRLPVKEGKIRRMQDDVNLSLEELRRFTAEKESERDPSAKIVKGYIQKLEQSTDLIIYVDGTSGTPVA